MWGDAHPTVAYWGTDWGPAGKAYVVVLVGDYSKAQRLLSFRTSAQATAFPPVKWLRIVFAGAKHDAASYGVYTTTFDVSRHPDLQPLQLTSSTAQ